MNSSFIKKIVILVVGVFLGFAVGLTTARPLFHLWGGHSREDRMMDHFTRKLDLNTEQEQKIKLILSEQRESIRSLREDLRPRIETIREEAHKKIKLELNPLQRKKYDEMEIKIQERRKKGGRGDR